MSLQEYVELHVVVMSSFVLLLTLCVGYCTAHTTRVIHLQLSQYAYPYVQVSVPINSFELVVESLPNMNLCVCVFAFFFVDLLILPCFRKKPLHNIMYVHVQLYLKSKLL